MGWGSSIFPLVIITAGGKFTGLFIYSPHPGPGNLIDSIAAQPGTDPFGNAYVAGIASYDRAVNQATVLAGGELDFVENVTTSATIGAFSQYELLPAVNLVALQAGFGFLLGSDSTTTENTVYLVPSGDTTGATDAALLARAVSIFGDVRLFPGTYYLNAPLNLALGQYLRGTGMSSTTISLVASAGAVPAVELFSATGPSTNVFAGLRDLTIDITAAAAGATGLQAGDILQLQILDVFVHGASGHGSNGIAMLNLVSHTEQAHVRAYISGCDNPVTFSHTSGDPSFDRGDYEFYINQFNTNGNGVAWTNGALMVGGSLKIRGNFSGAATNTGKALALSGAGAVLQAVQFDVSVEADGSGLGPQTIDFGAGSNTITGYGSVQFLNAGAAFQASNNNGQFRLDGTVAGDTSLQTLVNAAGITTISSGFPAGWSGTIKLEKTTSQDQVFLNMNLTITNGTVVTTGETIITGLVAPFIPQTGQPVVVSQIVNGAFIAPASINITSGGAMVYEGAGFTGGAGSNHIAGPAVYSNSQ